MLFLFFPLKFTACNDVTICCSVHNDAAEKKCGDWPKKVIFESRAQVTIPVISIKVAAVPAKPFTQIATTLDKTHWLVLILHPVKH